LCIFIFSLNLVEIVQEKFKLETITNIHTHTTILSSLCSPRLHLFDQKYSKNNDIVHYNLFSYYK